MGMGGTAIRSMPAPVQNPSPSNYAGVHSVQAISNPSYTGPNVSQSFSQAAPIGMVSTFGSFIHGDVKTGNSYNAMSHIYAI